MNIKAQRNEVKIVTKARIKVMNFEKEFFPKMAHSNKRSASDDARKAADGARRALQDFLQA